MPDYLLFDNTQTCKIHVSRLLRTAVAATSWEGRTIWTVVGLIRDGGGQFYFGHFRSEAEAEEFAGEVKRAIIGYGEESKR